MSRKNFCKKLEDAGHELIRDENGIDCWVLDEGYCNGPGCKLCGEVWCEHCQDTIKKCTKASSEYYI